MQEQTFTKKNTRNTFNNAAWDFPLEKPMLCPHCNAYEDGKSLSHEFRPYIDNCFLGTVTYQCTHCMQPYLVVYKIDLSAKRTTFEQFYPAFQANEYQNERLKDLSPRFIDAYGQALRAEARRDFELAAIGYRFALECLVKDYAVTELKIDKDTVSKKTLADAIGEYLEEPDLVSPADVVRILGNDYAHYERRYPECDFEILKKYMEIFIRLVETKVMISHPPVARRSNQKKGSN